MEKKRILLAAGALIVFVFALAGCVSMERPSSPELAPTVEGLLTQVSVQATQIADQDAIISYLATRIPVRPPTQAVDGRPTPFVEGSVAIEGGSCCVGGIAGQTIQIHVTFEASSPLAEVTHMRVRTGGISFDEQDLLDSEWEPFVAAQTFEFVPPINWSGFHVTVQYRDAQGNQSAVITDDISVEGMPGQTPTP